MGTISQKLAAAIASKNAIKAALTDIGNRRGSDTVGDKFSTYAAAVKSVEAATAQDFINYIPDDQQINDSILYGATSLDMSNLPVFWMGVMDYFSGSPFDIYSDTLTQINLYNAYGVNTVYAPSCGSNIYAEYSTIAYYITHEMEYINDNAFANSQLLDFGSSCIDVPDSVKYIGANAFAGTPIVTFGPFDHVETVGSGAFGGCSELTYASLGMGFNSVSSIGDYAFASCGGNAGGLMCECYISPDATVSETAFDGTTGWWDCGVSMAVINSLDTGSHFGLQSGSEIYCTDGTIEIE